MSENNKGAAKRSHAAGAFDIRNIIGLLLGIYGIVLLVCYFVLDPGMDVSTGTPKDSSYNLWAGIAMLVVAGFFMAWMKISPIKIEETDSAASTAGKADAAEASSAA